MAGSYTELRAWKLGVDLVVEVYRATQHFPQAELYGLTTAAASRRIGAEQYCGG
jgi:hypothetical protein